MPSPMKQPQSSGAERHVKSVAMYPAGHPPPASLARCGTHAGRQLAPLVHGRLLSQQICPLPPHWQVPETHWSFPLHEIGSQHGAPTAVPQTLASPLPDEPPPELELLDSDELPLLELLLPELELDPDELPPELDADPEVEPDEVDPPLDPELPPEPDDPELALNAPLEPELPPVLPDSPSPEPESAGPPVLPELLGAIASAVASTVGDVAPSCPASDELELDPPHAAVKAPKTSTAHHFRTTIGSSRRSSDAADGP
jgi:hypothetical protein